MAIRQRLLAGLFCAAVIILVIAFSSNKNLNDIVTGEQTTFDTPIDLTQQFISPSGSFSLRYPTGWIAEANQTFTGYLVKEKEDGLTAVFQFPVFLFIYPETKGNLEKEAYVGVEKLLKKHVLPLILNQYPDFCILAFRKTPEDNFAVLEGTFTFHHQKLKAKYFCQAVNLPSEGGWAAIMLGYQAPVNDFYGREGMFLKIASTLNVNRAWLEAEQRKNEEFKMERSNRDGLKQQEGDALEEVNMAEGLRRNLLIKVFNPEVQANFLQAVERLSNNWDGTLPVEK